MTDTLPPIGVHLFDVAHLRLAEVEAPQLSPEEQSARDRVWDQAVDANPGLFDGPVVACAGVEWDGSQSLFLSWARVTYRHYALRRVPGNTSWLPSLFVNVVQPTSQGRVLVGRMSPATAAPGRWQLPGGSVEPPAEGEVLDQTSVRGNAARELAEETGTGLAPEELRLWAVTRGENRSIGVAYLAPSAPEDALRRRFEAAVATERARGRVPELDELAFVGSAEELAHLPGPHADYLAPLVRRYTEGALRQGA